MLPVLRGLTSAKHFKPMGIERARASVPTGLLEYRRSPLYTVIPELGQISTYWYYHMRIACCAHMIVKGQDQLADCDVCNENRGYVCPQCLGAHWTRSPYKAELMACPGCTQDRLDESGKNVVSKYDAETELMTVRAWLIRRFPYGVPSEPTPEDVHIMDVAVYKR